MVSEGVNGVSRIFSFAVVGVGAFVARAFGAVIVLVALGLEFVMVEVGLFLLL